MGFHSRLSPSGASKYLNCTIAPSKEDGLPDKTSVYAARGTLGHWVAEQCLLDTGDPYRWVDKWFIVPDDGDPEVIEEELFASMDGKRNTDDTAYYFKFDKRTADAMMPDLVETRELAEGGVLHVEKRVYLDFPLGEGESGTCDISLKTWDGVIYIRDWKFGEGIKVNAEKNEQLMLYAIGAINQFFPDTEDDTEVCIDILQPLLSDRSGSRWMTTKKELWDWAEEVVLPAIEEIHGPNPKYAPSPKACRWCKAKKGDPANGVPPCPAYQNLNMEVARSMFPDLDTAVDLGLKLEQTEEPKNLTIDQLLFIDEHAKMVKSWLQEVNEELVRILKEGVHTVPGKKLVHGRRGDRKYVEGKENELDEILEALLGDDAYNVKRKSPSQVNDLLGQEIYDLCISEFVTQPEPKVVMADESSRKPRILSNVEILQLDE